MPSAVILFAFALGATAFTGPLAEGVLHGLKLVAVAVVAQAIWGMANSLTPDRARAAIALAAVAIVAFIGGSFGQIGAIAVGAIAGAFGGYHARVGLVKALRTRDFAVAIPEDLVAIGLGLLLVTRF